MSEGARHIRFPRLSGQQIAMLRTLMRHVGMARPSHIAGVRQRAAISALWRRELIEVWYRQAPDTVPALQGPYFTLTFAGCRLGLAFMQPRRGG